MNRRPLVIIAILGFLLLASNAWWFYQALDHGVTDMYQESELHDRLKSTQAALRALPSLSAELRRDQIIARVSAVLQEPQPFDKDGWTVIAPLMFRFDARGKLVEAGTIYGTGP